MAKRLKLGLIGGGNMAEALVAGVAAQGLLTARQIGCHEPRARRRRTLKSRYRIRCVANNRELVKNSAAVLLAVKPQQVRNVLAEIAPVLQPRQLVISIAAGLDTAFLRRRLPARQPLVRVMPNTPARLGLGATGIFFTPTVPAPQRRLVRALFAAVGEVVEVRREAELDAITALSGSGPAFVYALIEALAAGAARLGLAHPVAERLALQTFRGATELARHSREPLPTLIAHVTSKGGTTEAGLKILRPAVDRLLAQVLRQAARRAAVLRREASR